MKTKAQIISYLRRNHLYKKFSDNLPYGADEFFKSLCTSDYIHIIEDAFIWCDTPEGLWFWSKENKEFQSWFKEK